jgi:hypothetical protein
MRNSAIAAIAGLLTAGIALSAVTEADWEHCKETDAAGTLRVTVCLTGERGIEGPIVAVVSLRVQNISDRTIELQTYADSVELFRSVISGTEGQIMKAVHAPLRDGPESPIRWRHANLLPQESFIQTARIGELIEKQPRPGHHYTVAISPGVSFRTSEMWSFYDGLILMLKDRNYQRPLKFENVRLGGSWKQR